MYRAMYQLYTNQQKLKYYSEKALERSSIFDVNKSLIEFYNIIDK